MASQQQAQKLIAKMNEKWVNSEPRKYKKTKDFKAPSFVKINFSKKSWNNVK